MAPSFDLDPCDEEAAEELMPASKDCLSAVGVFTLGSLWWCCDGAGERLCDMDRYTGPRPRLTQDTMLLWKVDCFHQLYETAFRCVRDYLADADSSSSHPRYENLDPSRDLPAFDLLRQVDRHLQLLLR